MKQKELTVGILGFQGAFKKHKQAIEKLNHKALIIKYPSELEKVDALIIPGGESTTMTKIWDEMGYYALLKKFDKPIFGTCAGSILLSENPHDDRVKALKKIPASIIRNAYGRQVDSFVDEVRLLFDNKPFKGIFIRAPKIEKIKNGVEILGIHNDVPVFIKFDKYIATTFHPELTDDLRIHKYFIENICLKEKD